VNQNQQSMLSGKVMADPEVQQAINMARNDAAKVLQEKVSMMLNLNNKQAEIRLDPPELGSMQIRIRSDAEQAQVNFVVQNQQAKEVLEQSMPKLK
jgi:flagellar hook-length control protein FliK